MACVAQPLRRCKWLLIGRRCRHAEVPPSLLACISGDAGIQNTNTKKQGHGKCLEGETRGEKRVKRPKRPNALICRTPGGSIRYLLSCSLGMTLISHSIVSIPVLPSRFGICARGGSIVIIERCITYIRQSLPLDTVHSFFCLPSTCM